MGGEDEEEEYKAVRRPLSDIHWMMMEGEEEDNSDEGGQSMEEDDSNEGGQSTDEENEDYEETGGLLPGIPSTMTSGEGGEASDEGDEGGEATNEDDKDNEAIGSPIPDVHPFDMTFWDTYIESMEHLKGTGGMTVDKWCKAAQQILDKHTAYLQSMSKD